MLRFKHLIFFGPTGTREMARANLRHAALQLVHQSADHLSRHLRRRLFPIDLSDAAIGNRRLPQQRRMVRAHGLSLRPRNFSAGAADRSLPDVWRHPLRRASPTCCARGSSRSSTPSRRVCSSCFSPSCSRSSAAGRAISPGCNSSARRAASLQRTSNLPAGADFAAEPAAPQVIGAKRARIGIHLLGSIFSCSKKKAGAIPPTPAGTSGTSRSTEIFGGASRCKP